MEDHWEQVGISSFTPDGCSENSAIGYTRIAYYRDWIEEHIKHNNETRETTSTTSIIITEIPLTTYQCNRDEVQCGCGRRNVQFSQSHDNEAVPYSWSMIVSIRLNGENKHLCSGTILRIYLHPDYTGKLDNYANDIAILHISEPFNFHTDLFISQTCLLKKKPWSTNAYFYPYPGTKLAVIGWGLMNCQNKTHKNVLQQIEVYSTSDLEKNCYILNKHQDMQFCAGLDNQEPG
jgi:hypothetical protein